MHFTLCCLVYSISFYMVIVYITSLICFQYHLILSLNYCFISWYTKYFRKVLWVQCEYVNLSWNRGVRPLGYENSCREFRRERTASAIFAAGSICRNDIPFPLRESGGKLYFCIYKIPFRASVYTKVTCRSFRRSKLFVTHNLYKDKECMQAYLCWLCSMKFLLDYEINKGKWITNVLR